MINLSLQVHRATPDDQSQIAALMSDEGNLHRHLDWRSPLDWIGAQNFWLLHDGSRVQAAFACPQDPPGVAWIRLFGFRAPLDPAEAWNALWAGARPQLATQLGTVVAAIVVRPWFQSLLVASGFQLRQNIVTLELSPATNFVEPRSGLHIRAMSESDLPAVAQLDLESFGRFWHNPPDTLRRAHWQAVYASVVEDDSGLLGYQISTGNLLGAHLARLAVRPAAQGRGVGTSLVTDLVRRLSPNRSARLTVNTQSDNEASLALYKKLGFVRTDDQFPVLVYPLGERG